MFDSIILLFFFFFFSHNFCHRHVAACTGVACAYVVWCTHIRIYSILSCACLVRQIYIHSFLPHINCDADFVSAYSPMRYFPSQHLFMAKQFQSNSLRNCIARMKIRILLYGRDDRSEYKCGRSMKETTFIGQHDGV